MLTKHDSPAIKMLCNQNRYFTSERSKATNLSLRKRKRLLTRCRVNGAMYLASTFSAFVNDMENSKKSELEILSKNITDKLKYSENIGNAWLGE